MKNAEHLLRLAARGGTGGETRSREIVRCLLKHATGLDGSAIDGIGELAEFLNSATYEGHEVVKKAAGIR